MNKEDQNDAPHRNRAWRRWDIVGFGLASVLCATLLAMNAMVWQPRNNKASCSINLRQLSNGLMQYIREYDEVMPPHGKWSQALVPYVAPRTKPELVEIFRCPSRRDLPLGYAMHDKAVGLSLSDFNDPTRTVCFFDAETTGAKTQGGAELLPPSARHAGGHAVAFVDGHVKFVAQPDFTKGIPAWAKLQESNKWRQILKKRYKAIGKLQAAAKQERLRNQWLKPKDRSHKAAQEMQLFIRKTVELEKRL